MAVDVAIADDWRRILSKEFEKPYFSALVDFVKSEYKSHTVYPKGKNIFKAFDSTPFEEVKVVIIGQDPYHGPNQANGLCFSVNQNVEFPPSLRNIFKELQSDTGKPIPQTGDLSHWAEQGVLLLNATLTVRANNAGSHQGKGWETFTDTIINEINSRLDGIVYFLWGSYAQKKAALVDKERNLVLKSPHPSPLSAHRGFFGNKHFSQANAYLKEIGKKPINW